MQIALDKLPGRAVLDATGLLLGRIKEPLVDTETWLVDTLRLKVTRHVADELGLIWTWMFWKRPTIDVRSGLVQAAGDAILLRVSLGELRDAAEPTGEQHLPPIH
jgi:sporulation protein YlmC with PRC-barrel domain